MKKTWVLISTVLLAGNLIAQNNKVAEVVYDLPEKSLLRKHQSLLNYGFGETHIAVTNEFAKDSAVRVLPTYISYPYAARKIFVYGPSLGITVTTSGASIDLIIGNHIVKYGGFIRDSSAETNGRFSLAQTQVRITRNGKLVKDWQSITSFPTDLSVKNNGPLKKTYILNKDSIAEKEKVIVDFRNNADKAPLITLVFERPPLIIMPYMARHGHDTSAASFAFFVQKLFETKKLDTESINSFYRYWPQKYSGTIKNEHFFTNSKLVMYFRKPYPSYPDLDLEYSLIKNSEKDTLWNKTGHILLISGLQPGSNYSLLVRYKDAPANVQKYTFYTDPAWYQTIKFKAAVIAFILLLVAAFIMLTYRRRIKKIRKDQQQLALELRSIRSQLNPHFIFNALASIQMLINKKEIDHANRYLSEFSSLMRDTLKNNDTEFVPLSVELRMLETYMKLEQLRFNFKYLLEVDEMINQNAVEVPSLLLQPLLENAVKHGIAAVPESGMLKIIVKPEYRNLVITISDNGQGFDTGHVSGGYGLKLTADRIRLLNQTVKKQPIKMQIESNKDAGTTVHLVFENWLDT